jgi:hypothetical protein
MSGGSSDIVTWEAVVPADNGQMTDEEQVATIAGTPAEFYAAGDLSGLS